MVRAGCSMIYHGDCLDILKTFPDNSVDSMVTDPPAGIAFMNKSWDADKGGRDQWIFWMIEIMAECKRVMKPGAHGLVWALPRTSHWTATALEDAGFEVRDVVNHAFGSGFPKSLNISKAIDKMKGAERINLGTSVNIRPNSDRGNGLTHGTFGKEWDLTAPSTPEAKQWDGFGTALKPAHENWILVRKPLECKTVAENVLEWGCGGINIDASRISGTKRSPEFKNPNSNGQFGSSDNSNLIDWDSSQGRFPANFILSHNDDCEPCTEGCAVAELDRQSLAGGMHSAGNKKESDIKGSPLFGIGDIGKRNPDIYKDSGGASRFFYVAKASKKDKGELNSHPTVKNTKLMSYLITLITPPQGIVLDPFMGSGSTGVAAIRDGFQFIGIEKESEYFEIAKARFENVKQQKELMYG